jgi:hypothetical protein
MQFQEIKKIIKAECKRNNVTFYQGKGKTVLFRDNVRSNGYFTDGNDGKNDNPRLAIASGDNALDVLIHEYCHMQQYLEQSPEWNAIINNGCIWDWIYGSDQYSEDELDNSFRASYQLELDCEIRSVEKHKEWNTGINLEHYIQKANAYTMFYIFMRDNRVWYKSGKEPYSLIEVWSQMPKSFSFDRIECYNKVHELFELCI